MDMLNTMFDSGLEAQKGYQKNMEAIFETYMPKRLPLLQKASKTP
jgi:hypothetical protein